MNMFALNYDAALPPGTVLPIDRQGLRSADRAADGQSAFASVIANQVMASGPEASDAARKAEAKQAAEQLVASAFIIPILSTLRETSWAEGPFAPGTAEKRFGPMLDQHIADRIIEASNFGIVNAIAERYAGFGSNGSRNSALPLERFERIG